MQKKYEWKMQAFAKGIDPDKAVAEMERIENVFGALTPENILEASKDTDAVLHNLFTWNDEAAAHNYRLQQARNILNNIEVTIVSDGQQRHIPVFEVVRTESGKSYKSIEDFTYNDIAQVRANTVRELNSLKNKLAFYNEFTQATQKLDEAIDALG